MRSLAALLLIAMGLFRLGFLANLLSHPVISGFITASGLLIASSQLKHILGVPISFSDLEHLDAQVAFCSLARARLTPGAV